MHRIGYANSVHTSVLRRIKIVMEKVKPRTLSGFMELLPAPIVKIKYIYHNTNIHSTQENTDIFKVIVSIYNQFLFNVVFRQVL